MPGKRRAAPSCTPAAVNRSPGAAAASTRHVGAAAAAGGAAAPARRPVRPNAVVAKASSCVRPTPTSTRTPVKTIAKAKARTTATTVASAKAKAKAKAKAEVEARAMVRARVAGTAARSLQRAPVARRALHSPGATQRGESSPSSSLAGGASWACQAFSFVNPSDVRSCGACKEVRGRQLAPASGREDEPERRLSKYVGRPSFKVSRRIERATHQQLSLLHLERHPDGPGATFEVLGSTRNCYTVELGHQPTCSCPDFLKGQNVCKHVLFVWIRVLQCRKTDPRIWQRALLTAELDACLQPLFRQLAAAPIQTRENLPFAKCKRPEAYNQKAAARAAAAKKAGTTTTGEEQATEGSECVMEAPVPIRKRKSHRVAPLTMHEQHQRVGPASRGRGKQQIPIDDALWDHPGWQGHERPSKCPPLFAITGHQVHQTHSCWSCGAFVFCVLCGKYSKGNPKGLLEPCPEVVGDPNTSNRVQKETLSRIRRGLPPRGDACHGASIRLNIQFR